GKALERWQIRLAGKKIGIDESAQKIFDYYFVPTTQKYSVRILRATSFSETYRYTGKIFEAAKLEQLKAPPVELALLIRDKFSDEKIKEMGFRRIIIMHDGAFVDLLCVGPCGERPALFTDFTGPNSWEADIGFAFIE